MIIKANLNLVRISFFNLFKIACMVVISLFLKGCHHLISPSSITITIQPSHNVQLANDQNIIEQQEQEAEEIIVNGYTVTLCQEEERIQAIVKKYLAGSLRKIYNLPVYIAADVDLLQIAHLNTEEQKELIHIHINEEECHSYVYIGSINLLESGSAVDYQQDNAILHWASVAGDVEMVKVLLTEGFNVNANDLYGNSSLHFAAINNHPETINLLLQSGIDINAKNKYGNCALHGAAAYGYIEVIQILLSQGADVNAKNKDGNSILHVAAAYGQTEALEILLNAGANIHARNQDNNSPLHLAAYKCQDKIAEILIARGAKVNNKDQQVLTLPIEVAAKFNSISLGELSDC